jgi:succinyl-CoA--D-citramalate CoA-transferase
MLSDPHFQARQAIVGVQDPKIGEIKMQNVFPRLSDTPGGIDWTGPELGQHNDEVLHGLLGLSEREVADLREQHVV